MSDIAFTIGSFSIKWYSLLIVIGVLIAYFLIARESNRFNIKQDFVFNMLFWTIIFGILGARIYYVLFNLEYYKDNLSEIYKIWNGGIAIHGAIIFGFITILIYCKKYKASLGRMLDILVPGLLIAQAIGRWGNFFNHEAYGSIISYTKLIDMKIIPQFIVDNMYINGAYHLPMFYFESLACLLGFIIILFFRRRTYVKVGQTTAFYLIWYGFIRVFIESYRTDSLMLGSARVAQIVSVLMIVIGFIVMLIQSKKPRLDELYNSKDVDEVKF